MRLRYWICLGASILLAVVFLTAGVGKLLGHSAFLLSLSSLYMSPEFTAFVASVLPWVELVLGLSLVIGIAPQLVGGISTVLVAAFIFHNSWMITHGWGYQPCGCLGVFDKLFQGNLSTFSSLYIDIGLLVLALAIYFAYPGKLLEIRPWFFRRSKPAVSSPTAEQENNKGV
jgi:uncharacterized membrane protein YphA (DoxX/SURF4 family)